MKTTARFPVGLTYSARNKRRDVTTIIDIYTTRSEAGEVIKIEYQTAHDFMGQSVSKLECDSTVARSLEPEVLKQYIQPRKT